MMSIPSTSTADVCPVFSSSGKCGERDALRVMEQFRDFYEGKLNEVDMQGGGDCLELKLKIQRRWIEDLTEQTQMMARIVKELEDEATCRVRMLEDKLRQTSKCAYEVTDKERKLMDQLEEARNKIKRMKPCANMSTAFTSTDNELGCRRRERELEDEVTKLKCKCAELEKTLKSSHDRAENLQNADKCPMKAELKRLMDQNKYYEKVINCFKHEMAVMSEQLAHLQEILNLSNQSCRVESCQLYNTVVELQKLGDKLHKDLIDAEKKVLIENQKNELKDAKIGELQTIIGQKNAELNIHDEAINEMRIKLENTLLEKHDLENTIATLHSNIAHLQCALNCDSERSRRSCRSRGVSFRRSHSECRAPCEKKYPIEMVVEEIDKVKDKYRDKVRNLKRQNEELKEKLATSELSSQRMNDQLNRMKEEVANMTQVDCCREHELAQSKQIILEMRQTLIELNENLAESELHSMALAEEYKKREKNDIYLSARFELALYKKMADGFKDALVNVKARLQESEARYKSLTEELKNKDAKIKEIEKKRTKKEKDNCLCIEDLKEKLKGKEAEINEIQKKNAKKEKETCQCIEDLKDKLKSKEAQINEIQNNNANKEKEACKCIADLNEKLREAQNEEKRLSDFIEKLKQEVQKRIEEKKEVQKIGYYCECPDMSNTQEEINSLKVEIKHMIQNQLALNTENDKLLKQVTCLQSNTVLLEDKTRHLKQKVEKLQSENQHLKEKNKTLLRENEIMSLTIRNLEMELTDMKCTRDDLCAESRNVVNNVKAWLEEQKKINERVKKKTQCYCNTIAKLQQENETLMGRPVAQSTPYSRKRYGCFKPCTPADCSNLNLGSQGSLLASPRDSPVSCSCSVEEWYSPNYRDEDETDDIGEDNFASAIEYLTNEMRQSNKKWKNNCQECNCVSRDNK